MRILFVNTIRMFGGGEIWMLRTLTALSGRGHRVYLLCRPETELSRRARDLGIPVMTLRIRGDLDPLTILSAWRIIRRLKIQILLTNMDKELRFAGLAARIAGGCRVIPRRGIDYPLKDRLHYRLSYTKLAHCVIANSLATKKALLRHAPWLDPARIQVIYNGIDPAPFLSRPEGCLRRTWGIPGRAKIIGFIGQLDERKGIDCLLRAFQLLSRDIPAHLVLCGTGPLQESVKKLAQESGLTDRIHLPGFQDHIEEVMKAIDVLALPSLWEGFGIVLIEAMAAGKPVVTTAVSSMPEIVLDRVTGRVVPVNEPQQLAAALKEILTSSKRMREWGYNGRQRVLQHFTLQRMIDELEKLFYAQLRG